MKKLIFGLAVCSFALVLSGCGKADKLTCTINEAGTNQEEVFTFEDGKVTEVKSSLILDSKEEAEEKYEIFKDSFDDVKIDGNRLVATLDASYVKEELGTIEKAEIKELLEEMGYTCK